MPSEVARLILGYLKQSKCDKTHDEFLKESRHLSEYRAGLEEGFEYPTTINGKNLMQFLNQGNGNQPTTQVQVSTQETIKEKDAKIEELNRKIDLLMIKINKHENFLSNSNSRDSVVHYPEGSRRSHSHTNSLRTSFEGTIVQVSQPISKNSCDRQSHPQDSPFKTPVKQPRRSFPHPRKHETASSSTTIATSVSSKVNHGGHLTSNDNREGQSSKGHGDSTRKTGTPRKSYTPRKLNLAAGDRDITQILTSPCKQSHGSVVVNRCSPSKGNMSTFEENEWHIQPQAVVGEIISNPALPELLAEEINRFWNGCPSDSVHIPNLSNGIVPDYEESPQPLVIVTNDNVNTAQQEDYLPATDKHQITDKTVNTIMAELDSHPTISQFINDFALKCAEEDAGTGNYQYADMDFNQSMYVEESSPFDSSSFVSTPYSCQNDETTGDEETPSKQSPQSLTTPKSVYREPAIACRTPGLPVKNLMTDLRSAEKRHNFNSSPFKAQPRNSPFQEPRTPDSPLKIVTPDFQTLTASPVRTVLSSQYQPFIPQPVLIGQPVFQRKAFVSSFSTPTSNITPVITFASLPMIAAKPANQTTRYKPIAPRGGLPKKQPRIIVPKDKLQMAIKKSFANSESKPATNFARCLKEAREQIQRKRAQEAEKKPLTVEDTSSKRFRSQEAVPNNVENQGLVIDEGSSSVSKVNAALTLSSLANSRNASKSTSRSSKDVNSSSARDTIVLHASDQSSSKINETTSSSNRNNLNGNGSFDNERQSEEIKCSSHSKNSLSRKSSNKSSSSTSCQKESIELGDETRRLLMGLNDQKLHGLLSQVHNKNKSKTVDSPSKKPSDPSSSSGVVHHQILQQKVKNSAAKK